MAAATANDDSLRTFCVIGTGTVTKCSFRLRRDSPEYLVMFFTDIVLFYLLPLLVSVVLYSLIARSNLFQASLANF